MPPDLRLIVANGIDAATGQYALPPMPVADLARMLKQAPPEAPAHLVERGRRLQRRAFERGLPWGVAPDDVAKAGWAVVFHRDEAAAVRQALRPLIEHRRRQVGDDARVKELTFESGEDATGWLSRQDVSWNNVEPTKIPYYLLWVGSPERMPFEVAHEIDADYCVGLLHFDTPEEYARYAQSVVGYETAAGVRTRKEVVFFGTRHLGDAATQLSADWLITPLADGTRADGAVPAQPSVPQQLGFKHRTIVGDGATREALIGILAGVPSSPAVIFTATHGMVFPNGDTRQRSAQGALLCQDWPGFGNVAPAHFLTAADVPDDASVHGAVTFHFACYGGGTPREDLYFFDRGRTPPPIAPAPFLAALPRRLLAHPRGGALACIAHVERAWGSSITGTTSSGPQIRAFQTAIGQMLVGKPVGMAVQEFNDLSATLSDVLTGLLGSAFQGKTIDDEKLAVTWTQRNDAAGFVLIGDPAVRLRVADLV